MGLQLPLRAGDEGRMSLRSISGEMAHISGALDRMVLPLVPAELYTPTARGRESKSSVKVPIKVLFQ